MVFDVAMLRMDTSIKCKGLLSRVVTAISWFIRKFRWRFCKRLYNMRSRHRKALGTAWCVSRQQPRIQSEFLHPTASRPKP